MLKKIKYFIKSSLSNFLYYSGLTHIALKAVTKREKRHPVIIIMYHRIVEGIDKEINNNHAICHPLDSFKKELKLLKHFFKPASLTEALDYIKEKAPMPDKPLVVLTFDDGFKDNYTLAYPVLRGHGIPAVIFLTAGIIGTENLPWVDEMGQRILNTEKKSISINTVLNKQALDINSLREKRKAFNSITEKLKAVKNSDRELILKDLFSQLGARMNGHLQMLNWEQVKEMAGNNISFGAHTCTHPILSKMDREEAETEIIKSKRIIEDELGLKVEHFAFPNGRLCDFTSRLKEFCKSAGFKSVSTALYGINRQGNCVYSLKRMSPSKTLPVFAYDLLRALI
ncbi:MAG: polysaccharide deacetylase family protein [Candidatus Omnitrophota bacterium]